MGETTDSFLFAPSLFSKPDFGFTAEQQALFHEHVKLLVVGAGGLGCEILKNLALMGFRKFDVVDRDTIELTNLNRQFLFRQSDIGKFKAEVARDRIRAQFPSVEIAAFTDSVQDLLDKNPSFYNEYLCIISGLDNVEARLFLNKLIYELSKQDLHISLIDGGTEGHMGQVRVIFPYKSDLPCYQCVLHQSPIVQDTLPLCTL